MGFTDITLKDSDEKVIEYYSHMVYRIAYARAGNRYDADDIFQEVFLKYIRKRPVFNDEEHRKAWLIRVTINCSADWWKMLQKHKREYIDENVIFEPEEVTELYKELQKLPPKYRMVIHLFYYENMSVEEIGKATGTKASTVRTQLTRARKMLKKFMKEEDYV